MAQTPGGSAFPLAFSGGNAAVGDVRSLGIEDTLAGPQEQVASASSAAAPSVVADSAAGSSASVDGATEDTWSQKSSWINLDRAVATAVRKETTWLSTFKTSANDKAKLGEEALAKPGFIRAQAACKNEAAILRASVQRRGNEIDVADVDGRLGDGAHGG